MRATVSAKRFRRSRFLATGTEGLAIAEFAITVPIFLVLLIGIFDFGRAYNVKQKLNNIAREAARFGAIQPTNDLPAAGGSAPASVKAIRDLVAIRLQGAGLDDCGLGTLAAPASGAGTPLTFTYTATGGGCPASGLTLTIDRGDASYPTTTAIVINVISTHVNIRYSYAWEFSSAFSLFQGNPTSTAAQITGDAVVPNMD